jgi:hypothetical protein
VVVPYTTLDDLTRWSLERDGLRPRYVDVSDHDWAYWRLLCELWEAQQTVVIVEHDIVAPPGAVRAMLDCPRDWCAHEYRMGHLFGTGLGLTKLSGAIMARTPTAVSRILPQHRGWAALDSIVLATLTRNGEAEHVHQPRAGHLHYADDGTDLRPTVKRRNATLTTLLYVGTGRYLDGIPRRDFDTDDPDVVVRCVESGLYVTPDEPAAPAADEPAPAAVEPEPVAPADE